MAYRFKHGGKKRTQQSIRRRKGPREQATMTVCGVGGREGEVMVIISK